MKIKLYIENNRITGYQTFPIVENMLDIGEIPEDLANGEYTLQNGKIVKVGYTTEKQKEIEEDRLNELRSKREPLLKAYDTYKINVLYGLENTSTLSGENTKATIDKWYSLILDLDENSINNPPERIKYYL